VSAPSGSIFRPSQNTKFSKFHVFSSSIDTSPPLPPLVGLCYTSRGLSGTTGKAAILRTITPNSRRVS
jgi:hypothetical protein